MDILYLVDRLENLLSTSRKMPLVNQIIVKESDIYSILDQMRTTIPEEVKQARRLLQEKERILAQAQAEASALLSRAREESERAMNREGLLRVAEERSQELVHRASEHSQELVRRAEEHSEQMKIEADAYVAETLHNLKEHLMSVETDVSRTILSIERGLESITSQQSTFQHYDEARAEAQDEPYMEEDDDDMAEMNQEIQPPEQPAYPMPRRASLANDTIGGPSIL
jgi:hypothetical protein